MKDETGGNDKLSHPKNKILIHPFYIGISVKIAETQVLLDF